MVLSQQNYRARYDKKKNVCNVVRFLNVGRAYKSQVISLFGGGPRGVNQRRIEEVTRRRGAIDLLTGNERVLPT